MSQSVPVLSKSWGALKRPPPLVKSNKSAPKNDVVDEEFELAGALAAKLFIVECNGSEVPDWKFKAALPPNCCWNIGGCCCCVGMAAKRSLKLLLLFLFKSRSMAFARLLKSGEKCCGCCCCWDCLYCCCCCWYWRFGESFDDVVAAPMRWWWLANEMAALVGDIG